MSKVSVRIFRAGTSATEVGIESGKTVKDVLKKSGLNKKDSEIIQINGEIKSLQTKVEDGDVIILAKNIEGGAI